MHNQRDANEESCGAIAAYALLAIISGYICTFVGLLTLPLWVGIAFAFFIPGLFIVKFASLQLRGYRSISDASGNSGTIGRTEQV